MRPESHPDEFAFGGQGNVIPFSFGGPRVDVAEQSAPERLKEWLTEEQMNAGILAGVEKTVIETPQSANEFLLFLNKLTTTQSFKNDQTKPRFIADVERLLLRMGQDPILLRTCVAIAYESTQSCEDRSAYMFNMMHAAILDRDIGIGTYDNNLPELMPKLRASFRCEEIEKFAEKFVADRRGMVDVMSVYLGLTARLNEALELDSPGTDLSYFEGSGLNDQDVKDANETVRAAEPHRFPTFLMNHQEWAKYMERKAPETQHNIGVAKYKRLDEVDGRVEAKKVLSRIPDVTVTISPSAAGTANVAVIANDPKAIAENEADLADEHRILGVVVRKEMEEEYDPGYFEAQLRALGHPELFQRPWPAPQLETQEDQTAPSTSARA